MPFSRTVNEVRLMGRIVDAPTILESHCEFKITVDSVKLLGVTLPPTTHNVRVSTKWAEACANHFFSGRLAYVSGALLDGFIYSEKVEFLYE